MSLLWIILWITLFIFIIQFHLFIVQPFLSPPQSSTVQYLTCGGSAVWWYWCGSGCHHCGGVVVNVTFPYYRSTLSLSLSVSWHSCRCKQLSITLPSVHLLPSRFHFLSIPTIICLCCHHYYWPVLCQRTSSPHHFTICAWHSQNSLARSYYPDDLFHHMFVSAYHMFVSCTTWYFGFIMLYLTSLNSLVTYLFHLILFKHGVLICLSQFEISS